MRITSLKTDLDMSTFIPYHKVTVTISEETLEMVKNVNLLTGNMEGFTILGKELYEQIEMERPK